MYGSYPTNRRWLSLAAIVPSSSGDRLAGFLISVAGSGQDFAAADYYGVSGSVDLADMLPEESSPEAVAEAQGLPLLQLSPDQNAVNICLLATLPEFRRQGVATLLLEQATSSARAIRASQVFLHVMDTNAAALGFYAARGFLLVARLQSYSQQQLQLQQQQQQPQAALALSPSGAALSLSEGPTSSPVSGSGEARSALQAMTVERRQPANSPQAVNDARSAFQPLQGADISTPKGDALLLTLTLQAAATPVAETKRGVSPLAAAAKSFVDWLTRAGTPVAASSIASPLLPPAHASQHPQSSPSAPPSQQTGSQSCGSPSLSVASTHDLQTQRSRSVSSRASTDRPAASDSSRCSPAAALPTGGGRHQQWAPSNGQHSGTIASVTE
ncbi:MAG: hypothetical protein WDW36_001316 [Sanguina aurantia]